LERLLPFRDDHLQAVEGLAHDLSVFLGVDRQVVLLQLK